MDISSIAVGKFFQSQDGEIHEKITPHNSGAARSVQRNDVVIDCGGLYWTPQHPAWITPINRTLRPILLVNTPFGAYEAEVVRTRQGALDWREVASASVDIREFTDGMLQGNSAADTRGMQIIADQWGSGDFAHPGYADGEVLTDDEFRVLTIPADYPVEQQAGKEFTVLVAAGTAPTITDGASLSDATAAGKIVIYGEKTNIFDAGGGGGRIHIPRVLRMENTVEFRRCSIIFEGQGFTQAWPGQAIRQPLKSDRSSGIIWEGPPDVPIISLDDTRGFALTDLFVLGDDNNRPSAYVDINLRPNSGHGGNNLFRAENCFFGRSVWSPATNGIANEGGATNGLIFRSGTAAYGNSDFMILNNIGVENCLDYGIDVQHSQGVFGDWKHVSIAQCHTALRTNSHIEGASFLFSDVRRCLEIGVPYIPHPDNPTVPSVSIPQPNVSIHGLSMERCGQLAKMRLGSKLKITGGGYCQVSSGDISLGVDWKPGQTLAVGDVVLARDPLETGSNRRWYYRWLVDAAYTTSGIFDNADTANLTRLGTLQDAMSGSLVSVARPTDEDLSTATMPFSSGAWVDWTDAADGGQFVFDGPILEFSAGFEVPKIVVRAASNAATENAPPLVKISGIDATMIGDGSGAQHFIESGLNFPRDRRIYEIDLDDGRKMRNALNFRRLGFRFSSGDAVAMSVPSLFEFINPDRYDLLTRSIVLDVDGNRHDSISSDGTAVTQTQLSV